MTSTKNKAAEPS